MPTNVRYFADWITPATGVRHRMTLTPKATTRVSFAGFVTVGALGWSTRPLWGAGGNSTWLELPPGTIYTPKVNEHGYDKLCVGFPDPPTLGMTIKCGSIEGVADLEDVISYITDPAYDVQSSDLIADPTAEDSPAIEIAPDLWRLINTTHLWTWQTDDGDSSLAIDAFRIVFQGGHDRATSTKHTLDPLTGELVVQLSLVHIFWLTAAQMLPKDLSLRCRENIAPTSVERYLFDYVWHGTANYARVLGSSPDVLDYQAHSMYALHSIADELERLQQDIYTVWSRDSTAVVTHGWSQPVEGLELEMQSQEVAGGRGGSPSSALHVVGLVHGNESDAELGGWLSDVGEVATTVFAFKTLDQFLIDAMEAQAQKAEVLCVSALEIRFNMLGMSNRLTALPIGVADLRQHELEVGAESLSGADASIVGARSGDVGKVEFRLDNIRDHNNRTVPVVFNVAPHVGDAKAGVWFALIDIGGPDFQTIGSPLLSMNVLWSAAEIEHEGGLTGATRYLRPHHAVATLDADPADHGFITDFLEVTDAIALPDPDDLGDPATAVGRANYDIVLWGGLRLAGLQAQAEACIPLAAATRIARRYGDRRQTVYSSSCDAAIAWALGRRTTTAWGDGAALTGKSYHATVPGEPMLLSTSHDEATGLATIKLIAVGGD